MSCRHDGYLVSHIRTTSRRRSVDPPPTSLASSSTFTAARPAMMIALASAVFCGGGMRALALGLELGLVRELGLGPLPPHGDFLGFLGDGVRMFGALSAGAGLVEVDRFIVGEGKAGSVPRLTVGWGFRSVAGSEKT